MAPRGEDGTFESEYTDAHLAETVIATIARHAYRFGGVPSPRETTKRQFNDARAGAGHPDCPTAQAILLRIPMGWQDLLDLALSDRSIEHTAAAVAAAKRAADPQPLITEHHAVARLVDAHSVHVREQVEDGIPAAQAAGVVVTPTDFIRIGEEFRRR